MVKGSDADLTRTNVIQLGFIVLLLGLLGYGFFRLIGFEEASAEIASEVVLVAIVILWTGSYLFRVFTGKMTFNEQRKRYREAYENLTNEELQSKFDLLSEEEQRSLIQSLEKEQNT